MLTYSVQSSSVSFSAQETLAYARTGNGAAVLDETVLSASESTTSTLVSLDDNTTDAVIDAVEAYAPQRTAFLNATEDVLQKLGSALSQGQGAYVISYETPGGKELTAVTPEEFAKLESGEDPGDVPGYPMSDAIKAALKNGWSVAGTPAATQSANAQSAKLADEEAALAIMDKSNYTEASASVMVQTKEVEVNPATTALTAEADRVGVGQGESISIVWVPPSDASSTTTGLSTSATQSLLVDSVA